MAAKPEDLGCIAEAILKGLEKMVETHRPSHVRVFESFPGNLGAEVVSDFFKGKGLAERQELVWDYLDRHVEPKYLARLYGVHPFDWGEYKALTLTDLSSTARPSGVVIRNWGMDGPPRTSDED